MNLGDLMVGPDGNLWFPEYVQPVGGVFLVGPSLVMIGRITPAGVLTEFPLPDSVYGGSLTVGPDGNLWFLGLSAFGRITPAGTLAEFPLPVPPSALSGPIGSPLVPGAMTVGPDGNLWFPEAGTGAIGRITPAGAHTTFPLPAGDGSPFGLTVGPDGNLWFLATLSVGRSTQYVIGRVTPSGAGGITQVHLSPPGGSALDLGPTKPTVGPDGNLWFPDYNPGRIERIVLDAFPPPPSVTGVLVVAHSRKAITSILLGFDEALDPASARKGRFYGLAAGVESGQTIVFSQGVKIARVSYNRTAHTVRLKLAVPQKRPVQVTVRAGLMAADGMSSFSDFTAVVA
jgi:hypothetical protein